MTASLADLIAQKEALDREIVRTRNAAKIEAIVQVRKLMSEHGLSPSDLIAKASGKASGSVSKKVAAKYLDPISGATWTGRGLKPRWLVAATESGKSLQDFAL